jgi:hypothetical protein
MTGSLPVVGSDSIRRAPHLFLFGPHAGTAGSPVSEHTRGARAGRAHRRLKPVQANPIAVAIKNTINKTAIVKPISIGRQRRGVAWRSSSAASDRELEAAANWVLEASEFKDKIMSAICWAAPLLSLSRALEQR